MLWAQHRSTHPSPYLTEERSLLGSRSIRACLQNYSPEQWPAVVKLLLLNGIAALQLEQGSQCVLSLEELAQHVGTPLTCEPVLKQECLPGHWLLRGMLYILTHPATLVQLPRRRGETARGLARPRAQCPSASTGASAARAGLAW